MATAKGLYKPKNPEKYLGNKDNIRYMSSWELFFFDKLDNNPNVLQWASEEFYIPYYNPVKKKICKYYPDIYTITKEKDGTISKNIIEIKPKKHTRLTKSSNDYDKLQFIINEAKWKALDTFCKNNNIKFQIVTEQSLFPKTKKTAKIKKIATNK